MPPALPQKPSQSPEIAVGLRRLKVGLHDLECLFQPKCFYDCLKGEVVAQRGWAPARSAPRPSHVSVAQLGKMKPSSLKTSAYSFLPCTASPCDNSAKPCARTPALHRPGSIAPSQAQGLSTEAALRAAREHKALPNHSEADEVQPAAAFPGRETEARRCEGAKPRACSTQPARQPRPVPSQAANHSSASLPALTTARTPSSSPEKLEQGAPTAQQTYGGASGFNSSPPQTWQLLAEELCPSPGPFLHFPAFPTCPRGSRVLLAAAPSCKALPRMG